MDKIDELLTRRVEKIYPSKVALEKVLRSGKKLRLYQGFDPSRPNLHIGHLTGFLTLKEFQQLGHEVIFLIGDFTGRIGDPSGKSETRKALTDKQILQNAKTYKEQIGMILNFSGKNPVKMKFNSQWLSKLKFTDVLKIAGHFTVPQLLERDMFQKRLKEGKDIFLNEFMYPIMQGYDSVAMNVDMEIGGTDQMFNMMAGRKLVGELLNKEKFVLTTKLLVDSQGKKIGKTEGNAINIANPPEVLFGQVMSLSDDCILPCFELATQISLDKVEEIKKSLKTSDNPMKWKKELAFKLVHMLQGKTAAEKGKQNFEKVHQANKYPKPTLILSQSAFNSNPTISQLMVTAGAASSNSEAKRLITSGSVEVNNKVITKNEPAIYDYYKGKVFKVGKNRFFGIKNET